MSSPLKNKVIFVGDTKIGKTCILNVLLRGIFTGDQTMSTHIAVEHSHEIETTSGAKVRLDIWDTG